MKASPTLRFRHNSALAVAAIIALISGLSLGTWAPALLPVLVVPLLLAVWAWRAGTDVDSEAITVRGAVGGRRIPWSQVTGFASDDKGRVVARVGEGSAIRLTAVGRGDLNAIVAASGHDLVTDSR